jgi:Ca2+-binding EF-hand superfamily protein
MAEIMGVGRYACILIGCALWLCGCNRAAPPRPAPAAAETTPAPSSTPADSTVVDTTAATSPSQPPAEVAGSEESPMIATSTDTAVVDSDAAPKNSTSDDATSKNADDAKPASNRSERIALLTPGGPLIVDVWLTVDGRPHGEAFNERVQVVLDAADTDDDGRPTWNELSENDDYLAGQQPNGPPPSPRQMKMLIEQYDANGDGIVQHSEAASWLGRDMGATPAAFAVRSSRSYSANPRATSRVWQLLDSNRDGELSIEEGERAPEKFMQLDGDDDRIIAPSELATLREQLQADRNRTYGIAAETGRYAALHLVPNFDMDRLEYVLSDLYAPRQRLGPHSFSDLAQLYEPVDVNSDGWLEQLELADLLSIDPHLELVVSMGQEQPSPTPTATLEVRHHVPEVALVARPSPDRTVLRLGTTFLILSAHDLAPLQSGNENMDRYVDRSQVRLMVHDEYDALFEELDHNADGRLGEREIFTSADRLRSRDADSDGRLAIDELPYSMIVAFLRGEPANEQSFYLPATMAAANSADAPSWFRHADFNGDSDVSRREFLGTLEQFQRLDSNGDTYIDSAEAADFEPSESSAE